MCVRSGCAVRAAIQDEQAARGFEPGWLARDVARASARVSEWEHDRGWNVVGGGMPLNSWLETYRAGESKPNLTMCLLRCIGDEPEWVDRHGRTTVTHSTFLPPTHWRWP